MDKVNLDLLTALRAAWQSRSEAEWNAHPDIHRAIVAAIRNTECPLRDKAPFHNRNLCQCGLGHKPVLTSRRIERN